VNEHFIHVIYMAAAACFILALKWLSTPRTARRGVWIGEVGMLLAIIGTLVTEQPFANAISLGHFSDEGQATSLRNKTLHVNSQAAKRKTRDVVGN
jgi:hypothetical protein